MEKADFSRREFSKGTAMACGVIFIGEVVPGMPTAARAAAGVPIPPIKMTYYSNWQEIVEFFKKATEDFRKVGLTPNLNPVVPSTVVPRTYAEHEKFYCDIGSISWGATPDRLEPNFYLQTMMHSSFAKLGEDLRGRSFGLSEVSGGYEGQQQHRRPVGHPGHPQTSGHLARQVQAPAENL